MKHLLLIAFFFWGMLFHAQKKTCRYEQTPLKKVLADLEKNFHISFSYRNELIENKKFTCRKKNIKLQEIFYQISYIHQLRFVKISDQIYVITPAINQNLNEVFIRAYLTQGIEKLTDGSYRLNLTKLGLLPGITQTDALESLQQLPAIAGINETASHFSVRGGNPDQNTIYWEGIPIYQNGHFFGMISPVNPNLIDQIHIYYKGTPARYEGGASSIVDMKSADKVPSKTNLSLGINMLDADINLKTNLIKNKLGLTAAFRTSYRKWWHTPTLSSYEQKVLYHTNIINPQTKLNNFNYNDTGIKLLYKIQKEHIISSSLLLINSHLRFENSLDNRQAYYYQNQLKTYTKALSLKSFNKLGAKSKLQTSFMLAWYDLTFNDTTYKNETVTGIIEKENFVADTRLSTVYTYQFNNKTKLETGYQFNEKRSVYLFQLQINDKKYYFDYQRNIQNTHSLFLEFKLKNQNNWLLIGGIRSIYTRQNNQIFPEPRLRINKLFSKQLETHITGEIKHQNLMQYNKTIIGLLNLENKAWYVALPDNYPVLKEQQVTWGLTYKPLRWILDLDIYYKRLQNISLSVPYRIYDTYDFVCGKEKITGMDLFIKKRWQNISFWISYALMQAQYRFKELKNNRAFTSDHKILHRINTSVNYHYQNWRMALGWQWHSPKIYYQNIIKDKTGKNTQNNINNDFVVKKLSNFNRFDISAQYQFSINNKSRLKLGISIRNIFNTSNLLSREKNSYTLDTSLHEFERYGLQRTVNLSARLHFSP